MPLLHWIRVNSLLAVAFCALTAISLLVRPEGYLLSVFTPSAGLALAASIYYGKRILPGLMAAVLLSAIFLQWHASADIGAVPNSWLLLYLLVSMAQFLLGVTMVRYFSCDTQNFDDARELLKIVLIGGPLSSAISLAAVLLTFFVLRLEFPHNLAYTILIGWAGLSLGAFVVYPIFGLMMQRGFSAKRTLRSPMVIQFGVACLTVVFLFAKINQWEKDRYYADFEVHAQHVVDEFRHVFEKEASILYGAKGLFVASNYVSRDEFDRFSAQLIVGNKSVAALEWVPHVRESNREAFLREAKTRNSMPNFDIKEKNQQGNMVVAGSRGHYFPVYYVYPFYGNELALGFDLGSNSMRRQTLVQSAMHGTLVATPPLRLVQGNNDQAILIVYPIYATESDIEPTKKNLENLDGFVLGVFRLSSLFAPVMRRNDTHLPIQIKDTIDDQLMFQSADYEQGSDTKFVARVGLLGRNYQIGVRLSEQFIVQRQNILIILLSFGGFLILGIFTLFLLLRTRRGEFTERLVREQTQQLRTINQDIQLKNELLASLSRIQSEFINNASSLAVYRRMLADILQLTESRIGFIFEIEHDFKQTPSWRLLAACGCKDCKNKEILSGIKEELIYENFRLQLQSAVNSSGPIIKTDYRCQTIDWIGNEETSLVVIPIFFGFEVAGILGLAGSEHGYNKATLEFLDPFIGTCSNFIHATRVADARRKAEAYLLEQESRLRAQFDNANDTIISFDKFGIIESVNPAGEKLSGYSVDDLAGKHIALLLPNYFAKGSEGFDVEQTNGLRESILHTRHARLVPVEISTNLLETPGDLLFCSVIRDLSERQKVDRLKNEFVATVSHELRTPLTSIQGALKLINSGVLSAAPDKQQQLLDIAQNNTERLLLLVNDLLDMEKIESGKLELFNQSIDLSALLKQAQMQMESYAHKFDVALKLHELPQQAIVRADPNRMAQIVANLLSNAIKFTGKNTSVELSLAEFPGFYRVSVRDFGPGIADNFKNRLFDKFTQADGSSSRKQAGSGLGLSISKQLIELMGGHITYQNVNPGAVFSIDVPKHEAGMKQAS